MRMIKMTKSKLLTSICWETSTQPTMEIWATKTSWSSLSTRFIRSTSSLKKDHSRTKFLVMSESNSIFLIRWEYTKLTTEK
jgi:hypothetical protein